VSEGEKKNEEEKEWMSTAAAITIVVIILFFVAVFVWYFWALANQEQMFDRDCLARSFDMWGLVDDWDCPPVP
jgi:hypothetical protein